MTKIKAALIHFLISLLVIGLFFLMVIFIWYPKPLFFIAGVIEPLKLLILIDVIVGPMLTFIVYKKNKKSLRIDLSVIALIQIIALGYGIHTIYNGRASLIVFRNGEFNYLMEKYAHNEELKFNELKPHFLSSPQLAYDESLLSNDLYASYANFVPMADYSSIVLSFSLSVEAMKVKLTSKEDDINKLVNKYKDEEIVFLLLNKDGMRQYVVFSTTQNRIVDYLKL